MVWTHHYHPVSDYTHDVNDIVENGVKLHHHSNPVSDYFEDIL